MAQPTPRISRWKDGLTDEDLTKLNRYRWYVKARTLESACIYYRIMVPATIGKELGRLVYFHDEDTLPPPVGDRGSQAAYEGYLARLERAMTATNVHYCYFEQHDGWRSMADKLRTAAAESEEMSFMPIFLWGCDDNSEFCCPFNPAFRRIGVRAPNGDTLAPGAEIRTIGDDGEVVTMWRDGELYEDGVFDVAKNWTNMNSMYENALTADGVIVSSPRLADWYALKGCENIHVYPNCMIPGTIPDIPIVKDEKHVTIFWQGGASHFPDLMSVRPALANVAKKYKHVRFLIMGQAFPFIWRDVPDDQKDFVPWGAMSAYFVRVATTGHDINICPLTGQRFNEYKSAIKWYESSLPHYPAATLAADYGAFQDEMTHGENGLLYEPDNAEDFEEKLCTLVEDATLRKKLGQNAKDWVHENRDPYKCVPELLDWVEDLYAKAQKKAGKAG